MICVGLSTCCHWGFFFFLYHPFKARFRACQHGSFLMFQIWRTLALLFNSALMLFVEYLVCVWCHLLLPPGERYFWVLFLSRDLIYNSFGEWDKSRWSAVCLWMYVYFLNGFVCPVLSCFVGKFLFLLPHWFVSWCLSPLPILTLSICHISDLLLFLFVCVCVFRFIKCGVDITFHRMGINGCYAPICILLKVLEQW